MDNDYAIGNFICELRTEKGMTQKELGELMGVTNKAVSKWENGASLPRARQLQQLADILGCTQEELMLGRRVPKETPKRRARAVPAPASPPQTRMGPKYPNAFEGIGLLFKAAIMSFVVLLMDLLYSMLPDFSLARILSGLIGLVAAGFMTVGLVKAGKDEESFKTALVLVIIGAFVGALFSLLGRASWNKLAPYAAQGIINLIFSFAALLCTVKGIRYLARSFENTDRLKKQAKLTVILKAAAFAVGAICVLALVISYKAVDPVSSEAQQSFLTSAKATAVALFLLGSAANFAYLRMLMSAQNMLAE